MDLRNKQTCIVTLLSVVLASCEGLNEIFRLATPLLPFAFGLGTVIIDER